MKALIPRSRISPFSHFRNFSFSYSHIPTLHFPAPSPRRRPLKFLRRWLRIGPDNKAGLGDTAAITMELMRVNAAGEFTEDTNCCWTAGWVTWDIPFGWGPTNNVGNTEVIPPLGQFNPNAGHSFEINSAGDVTVRKFGNSAERLITGQLKLNGEIWDTH